MKKLGQSKYDELLRLRFTGHSIPEISSITGVAKTTVQRHIKHVKVPSKYAQLLREKQGGSKQRAYGLRQNIRIDASRMIGNILKRDRLFLLLGIYWGEGTKGDFSLINSDPALLKAFVGCLRDLGIQSERLMAGVRVYSGVSLSRSKMYWSHALGIPIAQFTQVEVVDGSKKGKLRFGMCRVRVKAGIRERLLIQTAIDLVGKSIEKM